MQAAQTELVSNLIYWAVLTYAFTFIQFWVGGKSYEKKRDKNAFCDNNGNNGFIITFRQAAPSNSVSFQWLTKHPHTHTHTHTHTNIHWTKMVFSGAVGGFKINSPCLIKN